MFHFPPSSAEITCLAYIENPCFVSGTITDSYFYNITICSHTHCFLNIPTASSQQSSLTHGIQGLSYVLSWASLAFWVHCKIVTTALLDELSPEDHEEYAEAAGEWSVEAPPPHIQSRLCSDYQYKNPYCKGQCRDPTLPYITPLHNFKLYYSGFTTGNPTGKISWTRVVTNPTSWIIADCTPDSFEWKDPSKIQIEDVYHLLDHWKSHQDSRLEPLIWASSACPLFKDKNKTAKNVQASQHTHALQPPDSDEEVL
ncbi:hypothetical protein V8E53_014150 [Lactarius tabidus]